MRILQMQLAIGIGLACALLLASPAPAAPALFLLVSSVADAPDADTSNVVCETAPGNGTCTLRAAIMTANAYPLLGPHTISVPAGVYILTRAGADDTALNGDLDLNGSIRLLGAGAGATIIDGGAVPAERVIQVGANGKVTLDGITVQHGTDGGIISLGALTLTHSAVMSNTTTDVGGGILHGGEGQLLIQHSTILSNSAANTGGGIFASPVYTVTVLHSTIASNTATYGGGVHALLGAFLFADTAIHHNSSGVDGGGYLHSGAGPATLINSTISQNRAKLRGGGLFVQGGSAVLLNTTVAFNVADSDFNDTGTGGGVEIASGPATLAIRNSIIASNYNAMIPFPPGSSGLVPDDCDGAGIVSQGYNLIGDTSGCTITGTVGNILNVNALLGALGQHGGGTATVPLLPGSPAMDAANPGGCTDLLGTLLTTDQRGFPRPVGERCDMGAYEAAVAVFLPFVGR